MALLAALCFLSAPSDSAAAPTVSPKWPETPLPLPQQPLPKEPLKPVLPQKPAQAGSPLFASKLNDGKTSLRGFVDLHTHPMSHLGFGGHLVHGAPDVGVLMPAGQIWRNSDCNHTPERAATKAQALGSCYATHQGWDMFKNKCGNLIRANVLGKFEDGNHAAKHTVEHPQGHPGFVHWPKHNDILHQQMWVDWIHRAYKGGMRVMVALAVNNYTLANGLEASAANPRDDRTSGDLQIAELKKFVAKHPWMEIAYSAADVRRIVGEQDKLAVIIGVELDDIGNFVKDRVKPSPATVRAEIRRLHGLGVRYAFPVHLIDNYFGGTAVYEDDVNRANCWHYGDWWKLRCTNGSGRDELGIKHNVGAGWDLFVSMKLGHCGGTAPVPKCGAGQGHVNLRGLTEEGKAAIAEMMRLGMIIDVDHASLKTLHDILEYTKTPAGGYPLVSGHNGLRPGTEGIPVKPGHPGNENQRTRAQYLELAARKGMAGVGWGAMRADEWHQLVKAVAATGVPIALGSDINGLVVQPKPRAGCSQNNACVTYSASFPKPDQWDYNRDGVAHIGLFPDALRDVETQPGGTETVDKLFNAAEAFAVMWERAESLKNYAPAAPTGGITVTKAEYGRNCGIDANQADITSYVSTQCLGKSKCDYAFTWVKWGGDPSPSLCKKEIVIRYKCGNTAKEARAMHNTTPQKVFLSCV